MSEGYILVAIGEYYERMVQNFVTTLRRHGDEREVFVITDVSDEKLYKDCLTDFERNGTLPKITLDLNLPFEHNIFLDADMLCIGDTQHVWDIVKSRDSWISQIAETTRTDNLRGRLHAAARKHGWNKLPCYVQGGFIYLRKSQVDHSFFEWMREDGFPNYTDYATADRPYKNSRTDQALYSLAHSKFDITPLDMFDYPVMTFLNTIHMDSAPTKRVVHDQRVKVFDKNVAFCHCMAKPGHPLYEKLFKETMR